MIIFYVGRRGTGKTLTMVYNAYKYFLDGWKIYSNFELPFSEYIDSEEILKIDKNSTIKNCVILIDEISVLYDSRRSMKKTNINFSQVLMELRKRNINILATTQFSGTTDLRFRQHVDIIARPKFNKKYCVCEVNYMDVTAFEDDFNLMSGIISTKNNFITVVYDPKPIFKLYDTNRII